MHLPFRQTTTASALVLGALAVLPTTGLAGNGGASPSGTTVARANASSGVSLRARSGTLVDRRMAFRGDAPSAPVGRRVTVQRRAGRSWRTVARGSVRRHGSFTATYTPTSYGRFRYRAVVAGASSAGGAPEVAVTVYKGERATYYGPGLYGNGTACGQTLTKDTLGVAHRSLPCGTKIRVMYHGNSVVVPVIDRGPFGAGANWDLTEATAKRIGMTGTSTIGVLRAR